MGASQTPLGSEVGPSMARHHLHHLYPICHLEHRALVWKYRQTDDAFAVIMTWDFWFKSGPDGRCQCTGPPPAWAEGSAGPAQAVVWTAPVARYWHWWHYTDLQVFWFQGNRTLLFRTIVGVVPDFICSDHFVMQFVKFCVGFDYLALIVRLFTYAEGKNILKPKS